MSGDSLGSYEILGPLGKGGMGEVYRAHDPDLRRDVAVKVLPAELAADPERLARLEREARSLAALSHPNVATIHGLEEAEAADGTSSRFLVLELVEGETLEKRLRSGPLELEDALQIGVQIARGLEAAHHKGIIHRDLKPANVKITPDGLVKILDFGLAKPSEAADEDAGDDGGATRSPTVTVAGTEEGVILGTAAYMSPEQARGKAIDRRTDTWSLGCVLYEMLTGLRPFEGADVTETLASILKEPPDWGKLPAGTPLVVRSLLRRCLRKDPDRRIHDIADVRIELEEALYDDEIPAPAGPTHPQARPDAWSKELGLVGAAVVAVIIAALGYLAGSRFAIPDPDTRGAATPIHTEIDLSAHAPLALDAEAASLGIDSTEIALSPDGSTLVYVGASAEGGTRLYLRAMDGLDIRPIPGTEGALHPFFSPDGTSLGFLTNDRVKSVSLDSGTTLTLCDANNPTVASWAGDRIYFANDEGSYLEGVGSMGNDCTELLGPRAGRLYGQTLPGGRWILTTQRRGGISLDYGDVQLVSLETGQPRTLIRNGFDARYVESGHLLFGRGGSVFAVGFDLRSLEVVGEPAPVVADVRMHSLVPYVQVTASASGVLAYVPGSDAAVGVPAWVDPQGNTEFLPLEERIYGALDLTVDGTRLAVHVADNRDFVLVHDLERQESRRIEVDDSAGWPAWSPDGDRLAFTTFGRDRPYRLVVVAIEGGGTPRVLWESEARLTPDTWTSDDGEVGFYERGGSGGHRSGFVSVAPEDKPSEPRFLGSWSTQDLSPNGRWLAVSDTSVLYILPWPDLAPARQIMTNALEPIWCPRCDALMFRSGRQWLSARVRFEPEFDWEPPEVAFETDFIDTPGPSWAPSPDGQRILVVKRRHEMPRETIRIVSDWVRELARSAGR